MFFSIFNPISKPARTYPTVFLSKVLYPTICPPKESRIPFNLNSNKYLDMTKPPNSVFSTDLGGFIISSSYFNIYEYLLAFFCYSFATFVPNSTQACIASLSGVHNALTPSSTISNPASFSFSLMILTDSPLQP